MAQRRMLRHSNSGTPLDRLWSFALADGEASYVGETVAIVVADDRYLAEDAAARVEVDYEVLPAVADCRKAAAPDAPAVRRELNSNIVATYKVDYGNAEAAFGKAAHVFHEELWQHRGGAHPIEGRGLVAEFRPTDGSMTVWASTQKAHDLFQSLTALLDFDESRLRVATPDVGGGFGPKLCVYPEDIAVVAAAKLLRRSIKWIEDRREHFTNAAQERDQYWSLDIAVDADAKLLAVRGRLVHELGAYALQDVNIPFNSASMMSGPYILPALSMEVTVAATNKTPVSSVRGAGYPQAAFAMERLMDRVARELKLERAEVRRRNLIPPEKMPYTKPLKARSGASMQYDSGDYPACQAQVLAGGAAGTTSRSARRPRARKAATSASGLRTASRAPAADRSSRAWCGCRTPGASSVFTGAAAIGQGLGTALAQICAGELGMRARGRHRGSRRHRRRVARARRLRQPPDRDRRLLRAAGGARRRRQGEEARQPPAGSGRARPRDRRRRGARGRRAAARGQARRAGAHPQGRARLRLSARRRARASTPTSIGAPIRSPMPMPATSPRSRSTSRPAASRSSTTWRCRIPAILINPMIVDGQVRGGVAHGIGNAILEWMGFDETGQPITTTFADYLLPTAMEVPAIETLYKETPSPLNPLGAKGAGEVSTIPTAAAVISAIEDALQPFGVRIAQTPVTPAKLVEYRRGVRLGRVLHERNTFDGVVNVGLVKNSTQPRAYAMA